ncbi:MAG: hypothetical protein ACYDGY_10785 [Acidimicrobiales bacterium]
MSSSSSEALQVKAAIDTDMRHAGTTVIAATQNGPSGLGRSLPLGLGQAHGRQLRRLPPQGQHSCGQISRVPSSSHGIRSVKMVMPMRIAPMVTLQNIAIS